MERYIKQYHELKDKHPYAVVLFRCGNFYKAIKDDATKLNALLGLTVKSMTCEGTGEKVDMVGFPHHSFDCYLRKLIKSGKLVAICDPFED